VRFEVETGRRRRTIDIKRSGGGWTVTMDGRVMWVDFARVDDRWSMLVRPVEGDPGSQAPASESAPVGGSSYDVAIESRRQGRHIVHVDGHVVPVTVRLPGRGRTDSDGEGPSATGPVSILAPMPGRVVKVLVAPGDAVLARQGLVVVEAMKMENELRAPRAGTVADVRVREGAPVEANVVLVVIT
jgi:biotin carboxyl carrier protein